MILNEGQINLAQQPDESEDDYMRRLDAMVDEEYDDTELEEKAYLANINEFKTNMKTLLSTEWKIENIMNELGRDKVFILNKTFPGFVFFCFFSRILFRFGFCSGKEDPKDTALESLVCPLF